MHVVWRGKRHLGGAAWCEDVRMVLSARCLLRFEQHIRTIHFSEYTVQSSQYERSFVVERFYND